MFIRKQIRKSKKWGIGKSYQVIETYREGGKVKQRVVCNLGWDATPELALKTAKERLEACDGWMKKPYPMHYDSGRYIPEDVRAKKEQERLKEYLKWENRVKELEAVVSKMKPSS